MNSVSSCGIIFLVFCAVFLDLISQFHGPIVTAYPHIQWLSDAIDYDYQADSMGKENSLPRPQETCPPVLKSHSKNACSQRQCKTDLDCKSKRHRRCCFNGCVYTCTRQIDKAPVVDWRKAPRRVMKSAFYWLIHDVDRPEEFQSCSTTQVAEDEDPLLCPQSYTCHIVLEGDPERGIPNRGRCIKEKDHGSTMKLVNWKQKKANYLNPTSCYEETVIFLNGATARYNGKWCHCNNGKLTCRQKRHIPNSPTK